MRQGRKAYTRHEDYQNKTGNMTNKETETQTQDTQT